MSDDQSEEKTDPASERKLKKLREDGIIASSQIGSNFMGLAFGLGVTMLLANVIIEGLKAGFATAFAATTDTESITSGLLRHYLVDIHFPIAGIIATVMIAAIGFKILVHGGFVFSMTHVQPSLEKVSPTKGLKNLFKGRSLTEFTATLTRFFSVVAIAGFLIYIWLPTLLNTDLCVPDCAPKILWDVASSLLIACAILVIVSIVFDVVIQKVFFMKEQMMTKTEVKKEHKEMMGQPEVRQERRRLQRDNTALAGTVGINVATAYFTYGDRVVALAFDPVKTPLPKVAAKARKAADTIAMIHTLNSRGVPGMEDEEIVAACELLPNGSSVPRKIFMPLATKLREML